MSHVPPALARRLDRLARRAHRFHRFAHHPLCPAYSPEVLRLGRRACLCKGCALAGGGAAVGALAGAAAPHPSPALLAVTLLLAAPLAVAAVAPRRGKGWPKLLTRAAPLAMACALGAAGLREGGPAGLASLAATAAACAVALRVYRGRGPDREACRSCPERASARTCTGFRPHVRREAAFGRLAARWIAAEVSAGARPANTTWSLGSPAATADALAAAGGLVAALLDVPSGTTALLAPLAPASLRPRRSRHGDQVTK